MKFKDLSEPNQLQVKFHYLCSLLVDLVHGSADDSPLQVIYDLRKTPNSRTFVELDYGDSDFRDIIKIKQGLIYQHITLENTSTSYWLSFLGCSSQHEDDSFEFLLANIKDNNDFYTIELNNYLSSIAYTNLENPVFLELVSLTLPLATDLGYSQKKINQELNKLTVIYSNTNKLWV
jgi:hypothetical protein